MKIEFKLFKNKYFRIVTFNGSRHVLKLTALGLIIVILNKMHKYIFM